MYETIFSPVNYGGLELKNRIIFAPTTFGLSDEEYFAKIRAIAAGGCAMIIVGDVPVGKSRFEKSLFDKKGFAWYQSLAEIVHSCGRVFPWRESHPRPVCSGCAGCSPSPGAGP